MSNDDDDEYRSQVRDAIRVEVNFLPKRLLDPYHVVVRYEGLESSHFIQCSLRGVGEGISADIRRHFKEKGKWFLP